MLQTDIRDFLRARGVRLNRDLGQHFLIDESVLQAIIDAAGISPDDHVVEIGAGIGVLTRELLKHARRVTAIEVDGRMIPLLEDFLERTSTPDAYTVEELHIVNGSALAVPFPKDPYKIVANIPYHITSPLLRHAFLEGKRLPVSLTLMIQREVAEKICKPDDAGLLTILVGLFGTPHLVRIVPPEAFLPPPAVDSAVIHIESFLRPLANAATMDEIFKLVKAAFSQRRKMIRNTIGAFHGGMERLEAASILPDRRPQTLTIAEWIALAKTAKKDA